MEDQEGGGGNPYRQNRWGYPFAVVPLIPPSSNHIFITNWFKKVRFLSKEADSFKKQMVTSVQQQKLPAIGEIAVVQREDPTALFEVEYVFFLDPDEILNKTFGGKGKKAATTRYKKMDIENRLKLVSDALSTAIGVDDSLFFRGGYDKCSAALVGNVPQIHIYLNLADPRRFGV